MIGIALDCVETHYGFGRHEVYLTPHQLQEFQKYTWGEWIQTFATLMWTKVSTCLFLLRIPVAQWLIRPLQAALVILIVSNVILTLLWIVQCQPVAAAWDESLHGICFSKNQLRNIIFAQANDGVANWIWRSFEVNIGIIATCIPALRPAYKWLRKRAGGSKKNSTVHHTLADNPLNRHGGDSTTFNPPRIHEAEERRLDIPDSVILKTTTLDVEEGVLPVDIMLDPGLDARIHFLDNSARILQGVAPSTSAHLMHERDAVAEEHGKNLSQTQLKDICRACGTILVPDVTLKAEVIEPRKKRSRKKRKTDRTLQEPRLKQTRTECLCCRRVTLSPSQHTRQQESGKGDWGVAPAKKPPSAMVGSELPSSSAKKQPAKAESTNASSKKRAKARKQGGLQALLEKSKGLQSKSAGPELDLMDFMKET
ncbi:MAG: hypothetical protein LQ348_000518 [Seirophora lacunosa]|nr:MAG: hypothetical protein LQ348_000518 [Seirophora lacunosa]